MLKKNKAEKWKEIGERYAILLRAIRIEISDKVTFEQRPEQSGGVRHADI